MVTARAGPFAPHGAAWHSRQNGVAASPSLRVAMAISLEEVEVLEGTAMVPERHLLASRGPRVGGVRWRAAWTAGPWLMTSPWGARPLQLPQCRLLARRTNARKVNSRTQTQKCLVRRRACRRLCGDLEWQLVGRFPHGSLVNSLLFLCLFLLLCLCCLCPSCCPTW